MNGGDIYDLHIRWCTAVALLCPITSDIGTQKDKNGRRSNKASTPYINTGAARVQKRGIMIRNELITNATVANTAEQPVQTDNVSIYRFGKAVYRVRTYFNLECTETLADIVGRLILQDLNDTD